MESTNIKNEIFDNDFIKESIILKEKIFRFLELIGFSVSVDKLTFDDNKEKKRELNFNAVKNQRDKLKKIFEKKENSFLNYIANGDEICPEKIQPRLLLIDSKHKLWDLFRYIKLHWSIPTSNGYGKRLNYIVFDDFNEKIIGIIGLTDPDFSIKCRDLFIGWTKEQKNENLRLIMDGYIIGAIPPYNLILGGKLISSMLFSNQIRSDFYNKYEGTISYISQKEYDGNLVLITTMSAFGKSSIYDRIKIPNGQSFISTGFSSGWGEFQFMGEIYEEIHQFVTKFSEPSAKNKEWGKGFRNRREVVSKCLKLLNISNNFMRHGIQREHFVIPLAKNYNNVLKNISKPIYYDINIDLISEFIKDRWIIPRSKRRDEYIDWKHDDYLIWNR